MGNTKMINIQIAYNLSVLKHTSQCKSMINLRDFIALEKTKSIQIGVEFYFESDYGTCWRSLKFNSCLEDTVNPQNKGGDSGEQPEDL